MSSAKFSEKSFNGAAFGKYVANMTFQAEKTFAVPCDKVTVGGKTHWAPAEGKALIDFLTGQ